MYRLIEIASALSMVTDNFALHLEQILPYLDRDQNTPVYMCFRDVKAFDTANHKTLAKKLLETDTPLHIM